LVAGERDLLLPQLAIGHVGAAPDVAGEFTAGAEAWNPMVEQPAVFTVMTPHPVFRIKGLPVAVGDVVRVERPLAVLRVDRIYPSRADDLLERPPDEIHPALVDPGAMPVRVGEPDQDRSRVRHLPEARLALAQCTHRLLRPLEHR